MCAPASAALAPYAGATSSGNDAFRNMALRAAFPLDAGTPAASATSSDIAFWGDRAFVGNYSGFRIFDISGRTPTLLADVKCDGAQGDPSVYDADSDGTADVLVLSVDRTMTGPQCGATPAAHDDPSGWEGLRIFAVEDPGDVRQIAAVYQDCGSHTNTIVPRPAERRLLVLNASYPLRPGPTCGPVRGPEAGRDPLHGVVQVVEVPLDNPAAAFELTELPITYPGDNDNNYLPVSEHGINGGAVGGSGLVDGMRACHDIAVFVEAGLVAGACGEQAQMWRLDPLTGLPDTSNPLWVYDQDNVDFWHSATFSWDGQVVNFIDESFGDRCPTTTVKRVRLGQPEKEYQSGNMFFLNARTGELYSEFRIPRSSQNAGSGGYCSSHLGNVIPAKGRYLLANAYYGAGSSIIDFTDVRAPKEIAYGDREAAGTWSSYWYERHDAQKKDALDIYSNDGVGSPIAGRNGFEAWTATIGAVKRDGLPYLNPQTQMSLVDSQISLNDRPLGPTSTSDAPGTATRLNSGPYARGSAPKKRPVVDLHIVDHLATD